MAQLVIKYQKVVVCGRRDLTGKGHKGTSEVKEVFSTLFCYIDVYNSPDTLNWTFNFVHLIVGKNYVPVKKWTKIKLKTHRENSFFLFAVVETYLYFTNCHRAAAAVCWN